MNEIRPNYYEEWIRGGIGGTPWEIYQWNDREAGFSMAQPQAAENMLLRLLWQ